MLLAGNVKQKLETIEYAQGGESLDMDVNRAYIDLREEMKSIVNKPGTDKFDTLFSGLFNWMSYFRENNDFLLEKIMTLMTSNCKAEQIAPLMKELQDLQKMLTSLKPLCLYIEYGKSCKGDREKILQFHNKATCLIYLSLVGKMDIELVLFVKSNISTTVKESDISEMYSVILNEVLFGHHYLERELYLLENLILLLESLNDANSKLFAVLIDMHCFLLGLHPNVLFRKLHLLQASFRAILGHSFPVVCSFYLQNTEVDVSAELICILDQINYLKSEAQQIKLYFYPRTDDLGFLEFFLGYLEDLMKTREISVKEEIDALHFEVHSLISLAKIITQEELNGAQWTGVMNMAYQAEYLIDLYLVSSSSDLGLISSLSKIIYQLKNIRADLDGICCKSLPTQDVAVTSNPQVHPTDPQVGENDAVVCLPEEASVIMGDLLEGEKLAVISIVGMGGVGKTTLALNIFKSTPIAHHFDIRAWCTVSQNYRSRDLLLTILDQVNVVVKNHRSILDDQELADHLCRSLKKRRYLIILDDIWDTTLWNYLKRYLPDDRVGSRIFITTRNRDVADQIGSKVNELHGLSNEKSWELFQKKMFGKESLSHDLQKISREIIAHCKGLPLSIVIIAGILSDIERTEKRWSQVAERVSSLILSDPQGNCKAILELSYNHLPNHLRPCFLYLGSYPEDYEISVTHLMKLWVAEGFVQDTKSESAEEVAKKYIEDLIVRSLVIPAKEKSRGGVKTLLLHDLLRDFCLDKAKEEHFLTSLDKRNYQRPLQDPRRLTIHGASIGGLDFSCHSIRSMICFDRLEAYEIENRIGSYDMMLLKVLEVGDLYTEPFPNISSLVHLRYLALGLTGMTAKIVRIPSSISKMQNLQTLILKFDEPNTKVIEVPDLIWDMVKLRHVHIRPEVSFHVDSTRLQKSSSFLLANLKSLSKVRVSCDDSKWLTKLPGLERVSCVYMNRDIKDNQIRMIRFNGHLTSLKVENGTSRKERFLGICQLPISLRVLTLSEFSLRSNDISGIGRSLPHLEVFKIYSCFVPNSGYEWSMGNMYFRNEWHVDDEDFLQLKVLKLRGLNIKKWIASENSFPSLEQLWIEKCNELDEIPSDFGYLAKLRVISVGECARSVYNSAREIEKLQHEEQNSELRVHIYSIP